MIRSSDSYPNTAPTFCCSIIDQLWSRKIEFLRNDSYRLIGISSIIGEKNRLGGIVESDIENAFIITIAHRFTIRGNKDRECATNIVLY